MSIEKMNKTCKKKQHTQMKNKNYKNCSIIDEQKVKCIPDHPWDEDMETTSHR